MDEVATLQYAVDELCRAIAGLESTQMDEVTNCAPCARK